MASISSNISGALSSFAATVSSGATQAKKTTLNGLSFAATKTSEGVQYIKENATTKNVAIATGAVALTALAGYGAYQYSDEISAPIVSLYQSVFGKPEVTTFQKVKTSVYNFGNQASEAFCAKFKTACDYADANIPSLPITAKTSITGRAQALLGLAKVALSAISGYRTGFASQQGGVVNHALRNLFGLVAWYRPQA